MQDGNLPYSIATASNSSFLLSTYTVICSMNAMLAFSFNPNTGINTHISDKTNRFFLANFGVRTIASWQPFSN